MKIHIESAALISEAAKALRKSLANHRVRVPLAKAQEALAYALGFDSLYAMQNARHVGPSDPLDHEVTADTLGERRRHQSARLKGYLGLADEIARAVVDEAQPSGNRRKPRPGTASEFPPELMDELRAFLRGKLTSRRRGEPLETLVREHVLRLMTSRHDALLSRTPGVTVDEFMSERQPRMVEFDRVLEPEMLEKFGSSDMTREWKRHGADKTGWEQIADQLRPELEQAVRWFDDPDDWYGEIRDMGRRIAAASGCALAEVADRIRATGLARLLLEEAIGELRAGIGSDKALDLLVNPPNEHGFFRWHPGIENERTFEAEFWRPSREHDRNSKDIRKFEITVHGTTVAIEVTRERSHCDYEEGGAFVAFHFFLAKAIRDGRVVGLVRGELLLDRTKGGGMSDRDFYYDAESQPADLTHLAHIILTQHMDAETLFAPGDLLYLSHWEVVPELRGTGFAVELLKGVVGELKRRHKRLASIAYELRPAQFPHPFSSSLPTMVVRDYDRARKKLDNYLDRIEFPHSLSLWGHSVCFEVTPEQNTLTDNQRLATHMGLRMPIG